MNIQKTLSRIRLSGAWMLAGFCLLFLSAAITPTQIITAQALSESLDPNPPSQTVKLIFVHHSTGQNWLDDSNGGLGLALSQNNYFVSDTNYGWGPDSIGDRTDIPNWLEWFRGSDTSTIMSALYAESGQHSSYTRTLANPGGENEIIMFKSCFPNSALSGNPGDPPSADGWLTVGHAKYVYNQLLTYFQAHPDKLFVVITAPPLSDPTYAANARAFNQWLINDWLSGNSYPLQNVAVFDFYNVLTGPNNHHRYDSGLIQHVFTAGMNTLYYPSGDDHPSQTGNQKATSEYIPLLNIFYHRWKNSLIPDPEAFGKGAPANSSIVTASPTLSWGASSGAAGYEYCYDSSNNNACDASWNSAGSSTSAGLSGLTNNGIYYWQVRATNGSGTTEADGGAWWSFTARNLRFADVPIDHPFWAYIEAMYNSGVTTGCGVSPLIYCPDSAVTRAAMSVFTLRAMYGSSYTPPAADHYFSDLPVAGKEWMEPWVDELFREGITGGCGTSPLIFCPETSTTRAAMAVFILRAKYGSSYTPPSASHFFSDLPVAGKEWMEPWVDELYREGITTGCGTGPLIYCPETAVKRQAMAAFIVRAFDLPIP